MKKYLLSAMLLAAVCVSAKAQFSLGIKGGVNFSKISANDLNSSTVAGYQVGAFARIGNSWYLQPELYMNSTGGQFNSSDNTYSDKVTFTNLNVPVLLGKSFGAKNLNFRVMAGPILAVVMNKSESFSQNFDSAFVNFNKYKDRNYGYQVGAGVDIGSITADLRYQGGIDNLNGHYGEIQNIWALSVGFKLL